ncbi:TetR/AcrR family transcriptional regulator [Oleiharenicola lentus]|uniref:TetR/AcrR family transcriptional regulator n=1 Tax=Oleiharenicola lentus TaxID=2508720 RepID=UPI003F665451
MTPADEARRAALLDAALGVFARFGFRKTSMDEVARAAQISRQGLYLHFTNKDELFRATVTYTIASSLADAKRALEAEKGSINERLVNAFDEWVGRYVGRFAADAADLMQAAEGLLWTTIVEHEKAFIEALTATIRESGLVAEYKPVGVTARQIAETLCSVTKGLKHRVETREEFREGLTVAVRIICAPLAK